MIVVLGLFLVLPIFMALWVSLLDWAPARGDPFSGGGEYVGTDNYRSLVAVDALTRTDFMKSMRNTFYYVLFVVPLQTVLALFLAVVLNQKRLRGKGFFRSAFYFPSVTSSVAISMVFLFLFLNNGGINKVLSWVGIDGPSWFSDANGVFHLLLGVVGVDQAPGALGANGVLGLSFWEWLAGPSVALCAIIVLVVWTTAGTFMLMFLAALQDIPVEVDEAALIDGATTWRKFRYVTLPQLKPVLFLVLTLGLISTWQIFDQVYVMSEGNPDKTTLTPAFLSYRESFVSQNWGTGAAIAFVLFAVILLLTLIQRWVMRDKDEPRRRRRAEVPA
ncbi:MAG: ABC transporter permease subunit [Propionibacteriales bacterium]|nr:ABC transporter permease subunit [Propionibacteriales bacterium]